MAGLDPSRMRSFQHTDEVPALRVVLETFFGIPGDIVGCPVPKNEC